MPARWPTAFLDGTLSADRIALLDDEAAIVTIDSVKGLGRWTAEIYLLFALGRLDVFPSGDIALAAALARSERAAGAPRSEGAARTGRPRGSRSGRWRRGCSGIIGAT